MKGLISQPMEKLTEITTKATITARSQQEGSAVEGLRWFDIQSVAKPLLQQVGQNNDGVVNRKQLADAVVDPRYTGEQAQALAGLYGKFSQVARLNGGDGQMISDKSVDSLYQTFYTAERKASDLIALVDWTKANFTGLDRGSKDYISSSDVSAALEGASGKDKTMSQLLEGNFSRISQSQRVTPPDVTNFVNRYFSQDSGFRLTDAFEQMMSRSALGGSDWVSHSAFADWSNPVKDIRAKDIDQGFPNDCSFNAPLGSLAQQRPEDVEKMISRNADGSYDVRFPGADRAVKVAAPTEAEQGILDRSTSDGYWPALMEKAYGQLQIDTDGNTKKAQRLPEDVLDKRKPLMSGIELLTGHKAEQRLMLYASTSDVADILQKAFNGPEHQIVVLGTGSTLDSGLTKDGFALNHGYSVLAYEPTGKGDGQVTVRDTYGVGGPKNDGVRTISVQQAKDNFTDIVFEK